ncbi:hypothetical protein QBZ16_000851 [Prototheca wickerhamii]|uniref:Uncharacterized protein n=1 Tax=Prototheca wickerhamii TaxID=3111 RepID=A0AAD9IHH4_PROWI|nr:hypothetical protein QBZ16_000851 [Prototheca wickerhamii]
MSLRGVVSPLSDPDFAGTAFVATDVAWQNLLRVLGWTTDDLFANSNRDALNQTIAYSIVEGDVVTVKEMKNMTYLDPLPATLMGQPILVRGMWKVDSAEVGYIRIVSTSRQPSILYQNATIASCNKGAVAYLVDQGRSSDQR